MLMQFFRNMVTNRTDLALRLRNDVAVNYVPAEFLQTVEVYSLISEKEDAFHTIHLLSTFGRLDPRNLSDNITSIFEYGLVTIQRLSEVYTKLAEDTFEGHNTLVPADLDNHQSVKTELKAFMKQLYMLKQRGFVVYDRSPQRV